MGHFQDTPVSTKMILNEHIIYHMKVHIVSGVFFKGGPYMRKYGNLMFEALLLSENVPTFCPLHANKLSE